MTNSDYKPYNPNKTEPEIYALWEKNQAFKPNEKSSKEPRSILLPPPNANADLHLGHAMYVIEDVLIRFWRMQGHPTLWIPGTDHAGYETQYVYEKNLKKIGKSRFDFDRQTLYNNIAEFVKENSGKIQGQLKKLGFSLDWSHETYMLDDHVVNTVLTTFEKMYQDDLIYRGGYMVNYCPKCGTTFANLEVNHIEQKDPLYYIKYGPFVLATVRPETKFGDTAIAVHPDDKRYQKYIGKEIECDGLIGKFKLKVIADKYVDPKFGTGVVKVTPAHDPNDYEMGKRHQLEVKPVIDLNGKLNELTGPYQGLSVFTARQKVVSDLIEKGLLIKVNENYTHNIAVCYKGNHPIEPMVLPNWFVKTKPLAKKAVAVVKNEKVKIIPKRFNKIYFQWMENILDWPISRQVVWGIRIPAWYNIDKNPDLQVLFINRKGESVAGKVRDICGKYTISEIEKGLQKLIAPANSKFIISRQKPGENYLQETDSFDTWFSSGQWPLTTLKYPDSKEFKKYYPTTLLDTMWDILFFWVARMIMFGIYLTGKAPFKYVYLHSMVTDREGKKMSKSKGNVINPIEIVDKYGADALRMSLLVGCAPGNPIALSEEKIKGYRNFANKIWNIARYIEINTQGKDVKCFESHMPEFTLKNNKSAELNWCHGRIDELNKLSKKVTKLLDNYKFSQAGEELYHYIWDIFADIHIEGSKVWLNNDNQYSAYIRGTLKDMLETNLKLLHPFMPFVTEAIWQRLGKNSLLITEKWPE